MINCFHTDLFEMVKHFPDSITQYLCNVNKQMGNSKKMFQFERVKRYERVVWRLKANSPERMDSTQISMEGQEMNRKISENWKKIMTSKSKDWNWKIKSKFCHQTKCKMDFEKLGLKINIQDFGLPHRSLDDITKDYYFGDQSLMVIFGRYR